MVTKKTTLAGLKRDNKKFARGYWAAFPALRYLKESRAVLLLIRNNCEEWAPEHDALGAALSLLIDAEIALENGIGEGE